MVVVVWCGIFPIVITLLLMIYSNIIEVPFINDIKTNFTILLPQWAPNSWGAGLNLSAVNHINQSLVHHCTRLYRVYLEKDLGFYFISLI